MLKIDKNNLNIEMPVGDSGSFGLKPKDKITGDYLINPGDKIEFSVKKSKEDITPKIFKQITITEEHDNTAPIIFEPKDTEYMEPGPYIYTIKLIRSDGNIDTLNYPQPLSILNLKKGVI